MGLLVLVAAAARAFPPRGDAVARALDELLATNLSNGTRSVALPRDARRGGARWFRFWAADDDGDAAPLASLWRVAGARRRARLAAGPCADLPPALANASTVAAPAAAVLALAARGRPTGGVAREVGLGLDFARRRCAAPPTAAAAWAGRACARGGARCRVATCASTPLCAHTHPHANRPSASDLRGALDAHPCAGRGGRRRVSLVAAPRGAWVVAPAPPLLAAWRSADAAARDALADAWATAGRARQAASQRGDGAGLARDLRGFGFRAAYVAYGLLEAAAAPGEGAVLLLATGAGCRPR